MERTSANPSCSQRTPESQSSRALTEKFNPSRNQQLRLDGSDFQFSYRRPLAEVEEGCASLEPQKNLRKFSRPLVRKRTQDLGIQNSTWRSISKNPGTSKFRFCRDRGADWFILVSESVLSNVDIRKFWKKPRRLL